MRASLLGLGGLVLALAWWLPLEAALPGPFSTHMTIHMSVVAIAAPLLAAGVAGGPLDPARRYPGLFPPIAASLVELLVVWIWHAPALHLAARASDAVHLLEQGSFLGSGLWLWLSALGGDARRRTERAAFGIVALLLTAMHMTLLGALLALPPRPLYGGPGHLAVGAALRDQHLGGAIMLAVGGVAYLLGGLLLARALLARRATLSVAPASATARTSIWRAPSP